MSLTASYLLEPPPHVGENAGMENRDAPNQGAFSRGLGEKLTLLLSELPGPNGALWTHSLLAQAMTDRGIPTTRPYITMLCQGKRGNPTTRNLAAIAEILGVPVAYFFEDAVEDRINTDLAELASLRSEGVHRLALRARGVSPLGLEQVERMLDYIRAAERLPSTSPETTEPVAVPTEQAAELRTQRSRSPHRR